MANAITSWLSSWVKNNPKTSVGLLWWAGLLATDWLANDFWVVNWVIEAWKGIISNIWNTVETTKNITDWILSTTWIKWVAAAAAPFALPVLGWYYGNKAAKFMWLKWAKSLWATALWVWAWLAIASSPLAPAAFVAWSIYPVWKSLVWWLKKSKNVAKFWWKWAVERPIKSVTWWAIELLKTPLNVWKWMARWLKGEPLIA